MKTSRVYFAALAASLLALVSAARGATNLNWDPGNSQAGSQSVNQPNTAGGSYMYRVVVPAAATKGLRVRLTVTAGEADLYLKQGAEPSSVDYQYSSTQTGSDLLLLQPGQYAEAEEWYILVEAAAGATWNLLAGNAAVGLGWDPGSTHAGTVSYQHPGNQAGSYWFQVTPQAVSSGAWRNALTVTAGEAQFYLRRDYLPDNTTYDFASTRIGSDGVVLRSDQFTPGETWFALVEVPSSASWSLVSGDAYVKDLGQLKFTDADSDGIVDPTEAVLESGSGAVTVGPEGIRYFRATVPAGTPAWNLWLGPGTTFIYVRKNSVPFADPGGNPMAFAERAQAGRMLLVPDYLQASSDVYYIGIAADPGTSVNLRSRIHTFTDIPFSSTRTVTCNGTDAGYRTFRVQVPIDQIAWETSVTNVTGDGNVCLRRDLVPNEFHNDAVSDTAGIATDSMTLAPPSLTNGTFFITLYGSETYQVSFFNGNPLVAELTPFSGGSIANTTPNKAGWRYYVVSNIAGQFGLGWELELAGAAPGTEIAIRRNAVPARWRYRDVEDLSYWQDNVGHVDQSSTFGLLQQVDHQADVWYIGIYNPTQALGNFTLTSRLASASTLAFNNGATVQADHPVAVWRWFRIDVPSGPQGWDLRLRDVTAGVPRMVVRRSLLPGSLATINENGDTWWPGDDSSWTSGAQWAEAADLTERAADPGGVDASYRHLTCGMGRPLEPGTYYVGVLNDGSEAAAYTLESRGIGTGQAIPITSLSFAGGAKPTGDLTARDVAVFKVTVPAASSHWSMRLEAGVGEMMMAVLRGTVPSDESYYYREPFSEATGGVRVQKTGTEYLSLFPPEDSTTLPAGDYYIAVVSEGDAPSGGMIGSGTASGTLRSLGSPGSALPALTAGAAVSSAVALSGGETKVYTVTVPPGTAALEVRLDDRVGNPHLAARLGAVGPTPYSGSPDYGYYGGNVSDSLDHPTVLTFPNPPAGPCTITVRARDMEGLPGWFENASATLVVTAGVTGNVGFDGGTTAVSGQNPDTWRFFRIVVGSGPVGWDLRLRDVTSGLPRMVVRRDLLPDGLYTHAATATDPWWPGDHATWPSTWQWAVAMDLTGRSQDPGVGGVSFRHLTCGMGRPLEPGTYYVGVRNDGTLPASYTLESRAIGVGRTISVSPVAFAGGAATTGNLSARDLAVFKVAVPAGASHWSLRLTPTAGELMMAVLKGMVPSDDGYNYHEPYSDATAGVRVQKEGTEYLSLFPPEGETTVPAGDYYVAVFSEGDSPPDALTVGTGTAAATLASLGTPAAAVGPLTLSVPVALPLSLMGGQTKVFNLSVPALAASLEVRLDDRTGNPHLAGCLGASKPQAFAASWGNDYGYYGGTYDTLDHASVVTFSNPPAGPCTITVRARSQDADPSWFETASATLVVTALPVPLVAFGGGTADVAGQIPATWRFFRIEVPSGPVGWDLRLRDVGSGSPRMVVRRDALPNGLLPFPGWAPGDQSTWPSGWQWAEAFDLTDRSQDPGSIDVRFRHLTCGMGRPLEPGTYYVGVLNDGSEPASYTVESRGIGAGWQIPVTAIAFAGGSAATGDLAARDLAVFKVTVPAGTSHWSLRLEQTQGELMMALLKGTVPSDGGQYDNDPFGETTAGIRMQKDGDEFLSLFPPAESTTVPADDYYIAVFSEGNMPPDRSTIGAGTAAGILRSLVNPTSSLGSVAMGAPASALLVLSGGETKVFNVMVPAGVPVLQIRLDNRSGDPHLAARVGAVGPMAFASYSDYGYYGGDYVTWDHESVVTIPNPPAGLCTITVRARHTESNEMAFADAAATLVVSVVPPAVLNFSAPGNQDSRQIIDGERVLYQVAVPTQVNGQAVLGWKISSTLAAGDVHLKVFRDLVNRTPYFGTTLDTAIMVPSFFTPGDTWYFELTGIGITQYTVTSEPVTLQREAWAMPPAGQLSTTPGLLGSAMFGDSGINAAGSPLPGDQGTDLGQEDWHFYAITVPPNNRGVLRTVLESLNGNPDLYLRSGKVPTTFHSASPPEGDPLHDFAATGSGTHYGNWVPLDARVDTELEPGTWYLGVTATGGTNCRYRLKATIGDFQALALNGGAFSSQSLIGGDWRYYVVQIPEAAPVNWQIAFATVQGSVQVHWRELLPPGDFLPWDNVRNAYDDYLNQGPYDTLGWSAPGSYTISGPPLRPNSTVWLGVRATSDAVFSISSASSGGTLPIAGTLDFFSGYFAGTVPTGDGLVFKIPAPADASRLKFTGTHSGNLEFRLEQGAWPTLSGAAHWSSGLNSPETTVNLALTTDSWPWQPNRAYYLRLVSHSGNPEAVIIQLNGSTAATEDENNNGLYDWWERLHFGENGWGHDAGWDPDLDGWPNLMEAVQATDPNHPDGAALTTPVISGAPRVLGIRFSLADPIPSDATLVVEASVDLKVGSWLTIATRAANGAWSGTAAVEQAPPANGKITVTVRDTAHAGVAKRFLRLRVFR
jgi:hypothetical protein